MRPGEKIHIGVILMHPVAIENGLRFAIKEIERTVGFGVVFKTLVALLKSNMPVSIRIVDSIASNSMHIIVEYLDPSVLIRHPEPSPRDPLRRTE